MGASRRQTITPFANGVVTTFAPEAGPPTAAYVGVNGTLTNDGGGEAVVSVRPGWEQLLNQAGRTYLRLGAYRYYDAASAKTTVAAAYLASIYTYDDFGTFTYAVRLHNVSTGAVVATDSLTPTDALLATVPVMVQANNMLFTAGGKAGTLRKFNSTTASTWGIEAPSTAPTIADAGTAGAHSGTYEARVTFYNSATGHESSAGPTSSTVTVTAKDLSWTSIPTSSDAQVTHRYLYLRNTGTMTQFYKVAEIANNTATTATTDVADSLLVTPGPDTAENNPPPDNAFIGAWHKSRMFLSDGVFLYFSALGNPEAFDPDNYETLDTNDNGGLITALASHEGDLIIFKERATYALLGDDPNTWELRLVDPTNGCVGAGAVAAAAGRLFVWTHRGPAIFAGGEFSFIGQELLWGTLNSSLTLYDATDLGGVVAVAQEEHDVVFWAVPEGVATQNTWIVPFNYKLNRFESSKWDPFIGVSALGVVSGSGSGLLPYVFLGTDDGQLYKEDPTAVGDGYVAGTASGTFVASGSGAGVNITTLTDGSAAFNTTYYRGLTVRVYDTTTGLLVGSSRCTGATATVLTFAPAIEVTGGTTYGYSLGKPHFQWKTRHLHFGSPFTMKRWQFLNVIAQPSNAVVNIYTDASSGTPVKTASLASGTTRIRLGLSARALIVEVVDPVASHGANEILHMDVTYEDRGEVFQ